jgi:predicted nucleotidyltransferase
MTNRESKLATLRNHKQEMERFGIMEMGLFGSYARDERSRESL